MGKLALEVRTGKHPHAVDRDDPSTERQIGFKVTVTLTSDKKASSTLQEKYKLEQWVTDQYWLQTRDSDTSATWEDEEEESTPWERDEFGEDDDRGEWDPTQTETIFWDEPGFLGTTGRNRRALDKTQRLGYYEISFKWKIYDGEKILLETEAITLKADPNDEGHIIYSDPVAKTWTVEV